MRRREPVDDPAASDPWWAGDLDQCVRSFWVWMGRRWLDLPGTPLSYPTRRAEEVRAMTLRRHGVDPGELPPPPGRDREGRRVEEVDR